MVGKDPQDQRETVETEEAMGHREVQDKKGSQVKKVNRETQDLQDLLDLRVGRDLQARRDLVGLQVLLGQVDQFQPRVK